VPQNVLSLLDGPEHCGFDALALLTMGSPLGNTFQTSEDARQYVRDPGNEFRAQTFESFEPSVQMPNDARFTGFSYGTDELWISDRTIDRMIYVVRAGVAEQWPRARELFACA
jgi:hypothetical protein